jgi:2,5-diamino-6-(ribosylamino)-4(3H)-pyrimidinone 5'-phosphate reductase
LKKSRPHITINVAMTADGKIDTVERQGAKISSPTDWERVDRLRADHDAVMVGGRTLLAEDPRLTVKSAGLREERLARGVDANPVKVGIVSEAQFSPNSQFLTYGDARVILFTTNRTTSTQIEHLREQGAEVYIIGERKVDLPKAIEKIWELGIKSILAEGGGTLNSVLIQSGLVDELLIYVAPLIFGGSDAPTLADGMGLTQKNAIQLKIQSVDALEDGGVLLRYRVPK